MRQNVVCIIFGNLYIYLYLASYFVLASCTYWVWILLCIYGLDKTGEVWQISPGSRSPKKLASLRGYTDMGYLWMQGL